MAKKSNYTIDYSKKVLEVRNLKTYFKVGTGKNKLLVRAVDDISFDVHKGEVFGLVGESGCGKTTASRTIIRLYRPTSGKVTFEGKVVGAGNDEFYVNIKQARAQYEIDKIKLDSRKYAIYQINQKYAEKLDEIELQKRVLEKEYNQAVQEANSVIDQYKRNVFEEKNSFELRKEAAKYEFVTEKLQLYTQTINEFEIEYEKVKKSSLKALKNKLIGLDDSVGISKEERDAQKEIQKQNYQKYLVELEETYRPKIDEKAQNLLPKEEYKKSVAVFAQEYKEAIAKLNLEHHENLAKIEKPNTESLKAKLTQLKKNYDEQITALNLKRAQLLKEKRDEIAKVGKETVVDKEGLERLKQQFQAYIQEQREHIKAAKIQHYRSEAIEQAKNMQMIFQDPISSLNPRMTVGEIVSEGLIVNGEKDPEVIKSKVIDALKMVGLQPDYISRYPHEFSGGQRQRIGIARALIMNPSFIIADEPISALDVSIRAQVLNLLTELKEQLGLTILFIAHDLSVVKFFCDRIAVMYAGKIVELATSEEIFSHPLHAYTKSLLSAIPQPDPDVEKLRKRIPYSPAVHDYSKDLPELREVKPGHFVYCNNAEYQDILKSLGDSNA